MHYSGGRYPVPARSRPCQCGQVLAGTTADALPVIKSKAVVDLLKKYKVLSKRETVSRYEVYAEQYIMTIEVETKLMLNIARTMIFPAAIRYQGELATSLAGLKAVGIDTDADTLTHVTRMIADLQGAIKTLSEVSAADHKSPEAGCNHCRDAIIPAMEALRAVVDELEGVVADEHWPLPTYQEMLFIR